MIRFGNWNNGSNDGLWFVNGNYTPGNANINVSDRDNLQRTMKPCLSERKLKLRK